MRPGFLLAIFGLGAFVLLALILIPPRARTPAAQEPSPPISAVAAPGIASPTRDVPPLAEPAALLEAQLSTNAPVKKDASRNEAMSAADLEEQREAQVAVRIDKLHDLSRKSDTASLQTLLSEVRNPDQEIRQAALDAISQSRNRNAIPALEEAVAQMENSRDKQAIEEVIEFLKLPTLTEILREQSATNGNNAPVDRR